MKEATTSHNYRGFTIVKHDTGGRRMGREVGYRVMQGNDQLHAAWNLQAAKVWVDVQLDTTDEERAAREAFAAAILAEAGR